MRRALSSLLVLLCTSCGLLDDGYDDAARTEYLRFTDPAFERYCLETLDLNDDGRISRYEAERIVRMDCSGCGIASLDEISDCSGNLLSSLDLRGDTALSTLVCGGNALRTLDVSGCAAVMERVDTQSSPELETLYVSSTQEIRQLQVDGHTDVVVL